MALSVIGAGFPRTGTMSMKLALERLGFGPCHHMIEVFAHPESWPLWSRVADGEPVEWEDIFGGYRACTDAPGCWVWRELIERYPEAKVVLTVRDPESWFRSMSDTILSQMHTEDMQGLGIGPAIAKMAGRAMGAGPDAMRFAPDPEAMKAAFRAHYDAVRGTVPKDRLLEMQVSEGWGPLCRFLGVPVPDQPFPKVNSTGEFGASGALQKARSSQAQAGRAGS